MDMTTILLAMVLVGVGFVMYVMGKDTNKKDKFNTASAGIIIFGIVLLGAGAGGFLSFDSGSADVTVPDGEEPIGEAVERPIDKITYTGINELNNARDEVSGIVQFYDKSNNPSSPTSVYIDSISIENGTGNTQANVLLTDTEYKPVFNGEDAYYDVDMGSEVFNFVSGVNTQIFSEEFKTSKIATIGSIMDTTETTDYFSNTSGDVTTYNRQGQVTVSGSDVVYNSSIESGTFTIPVSISVTGASSEIKDAVMCFNYDSTNTPSGDEYTSITATPITGKTYTALEGELVDYWTSESCIPLGDINSGSYSKYNFVFNTVDSNIDSNDEWSIVIDDMGEYRGTDIAGEQKATAETQLIDHQ